MGMLSDVQNADRLDALTRLLYQSNENRDNFFYDFWLDDAVKEKRRGKLRWAVLFHQDNAPAYSAVEHCQASEIPCLNYSVTHHVRQT